MSQELNFERCKYTSFTHVSIRIWTYIKAGPEEEVEDDLNAGRESQEKGVEPPYQFGIVTFYQAWVYNPEGVVDQAGAVALLDGGLAGHGGAGHHQVENRNRTGIFV